MGIPKYKPRKQKEKDVNKKLYEGFKIWTSYYRANPQLFATDYLGVPLFTFQKILLYMMNISSIFIFIASRGIGKSYLISVFCIVRAILYPRSKIIVASATKGQSRLLISQKIDKELRLKYPNIAREIADIKTGQNESVVVFKNGSTIEAVASNQNSRGYRGQILVVDEYRMVSLEIITSVLKPFLNVIRMPNFRNKAKYKDYPIEENKELYMSSAWFKQHWAYNKFKEVAMGMCKKEDSFVCDLDYKLAINHGLLTQKRADDMKSSDDMDAITWQMELEGLWYGGNTKSFFQFEDVAPCRNLVKPFYPPTSLEYLERKQNPKIKNRNIIPKMIDEIRVIGYDVSLMSGSSNDNSVFTLMRLIPSGIGYEKQVVYIETINGGLSEDQALRLKQLFYDFEADYIAMDTNGNGIAVYDELVKTTYDTERDEEYYRATCC